MKYVDQSKTVYWQQRRGNDIEKASHDWLIARGLCLLIHDIPSLNHQVCLVPQKHSISSRYLLQHFVVTYASTGKKIGITNIDVSNKTIFAFKANCHR